MVWEASEKIKEGRVTLCGTGPLCEESYATIFPELAGLRIALGTAMLEAFVRGERGFADEVLKAFKQLDVLFRRNRMKEITRRLMPYAFDIATACHTKAKRREAVEAKLGRKLCDEDWDRLQKQLHWTRIPKGKRGAVKTHKRR